MSEEISSRLNLIGKSAELQKGKCVHIGGFIGVLRFFNHSKANFSDKLFLRLFC